MVRRAVEVGRSLEGLSGFEILALDERSKDNTLSVLSILHATVQELRTLQDLEPGRAIMRTARVARGRAWLLADERFEVDDACWAADQVLRGHCAALIPGHLLALERGFGQAVLGWSRVGLVGAQREVTRALQARGEAPASRSAGAPPLSRRARMFVRSQLGRLGLGHLDRPAPIRLRLPGN